MFRVEDMKMLFPIQTARLILRPFEDRDIDPFARYRSDPEVARYQGWEAPFSRERAAQFVAEMHARIPGAPGEWYQIAIERQTDGEMIGDCAFKRLAEDPRQAEIGITLAREFQGQGYAAEAIDCLLATLFGEFDLHRVRADIDPNNLASARVLGRVGMRYEGRFVQSLWFKGGWADEDWYAILQDEWKQRAK
jgi:RimJ/RimL family protein N-acetyltransferase